MAEPKQDKPRRWFGLKLRDRLFLASAALSSAILLVAAWVINVQVVGQARQQVQAEVETLLPFYDAAWQEHARSLATLGRTIATSPVVKALFGDPRAARDRETIRDLIEDFRRNLSERVDLFLITDGAGQVTFIETGGEAVPQVTELASARQAAEAQNQTQGFALIGGRLFQLSLTPILLHSGNEDYNNTLAVLGTGAELDRRLAEEFKQRLHSEVIFFVADQLSASSFAPQMEAVIASSHLAQRVSGAEPARPAEINIGGEAHLAFSRQLTGMDGQRLGWVVVLRSLKSAGELFRQISNLLVLLWTLSIAAALALSYLIADRITRPVEALAAGARELGRGNYEHEIQTAVGGEIGQLAQAFDQMRQSIKRTQAELLCSERLATIGRMASSIVHDLRNPLATVSTAAEVLSFDGLAPDRRQALVESQLRASQRMNDLLQELLEFSRGSYQLDLTRQRAADIVDYAIEEVRSLAARSSASIQSHVPADLVIKADGERLQRVFENLLINAIQAMPRGGQITVHATKGNGRVRIDVIDNGPGVPAAIRESLFEPFVSHGKQGGTGLGLAIAQGIVEAHGGRINLESGASQGADFFIELPLDEGD
jgi:signal transduction histidine kinase